MRSEADVAATTGGGVDLVNTYVGAWKRMYWITGSSPAANPPIVPAALLKVPRWRSMCSFTPAERGSHLRY